MAAAENQPLMGNGGPAFEWSPGIAIQDDHQVPILIDHIGHDVLDDSPDALPVETTMTTTAKTPKWSPQKKTMNKKTMKMFSPNKDGEEPRSDTTKKRMKKRSKKWLKTARTTIQHQAMTSSLKRTITMKKPSSRAHPRPRTSTSKVQPSTESGAHVQQPIFPQHGQPQQLQKL